MGALRNLSCRAPGRRSRRFRWVKAPTSAELSHLAWIIGQRVGRFLERRGLLKRGVENSYLGAEAVEAGLLDQLPGHSITNRTAVGPNQGRQVFTVQTLPATRVGTAV